MINCLPAKKIKTPTEFGKVGVLMGGVTGERSISLEGGKRVSEALKKQHIDIVEVDVSKKEKLKIPADVDRVFIMLHGRGGEDGRIQGALDTRGVPYTGSGVLGSALTMDKATCKRVWQAHGMKTPDFMVVTSKDDLTMVGEKIGYPLIVKPIEEGSSLGMTVVHESQYLSQAVAKAEVYGCAVMVERWVEGDEYTVGIINGCALPSIKIKAPNQFYDFEAKYIGSETQFSCPSGLPRLIENKLQETALTAFNVVKCDGWGRVDLFLDANNDVWLIEVNTVPGMTDHSLIPMAAQVAGLSFNELVWAILESSDKSKLVGLEV